MYTTTLYSYRTLSLGVPGARSAKSLASIVLYWLIAIMLIGCSDEQRQLTTADRMRGVQIRQETVADFHLQRKSVDYMSDLRDLQDKRDGKSAPNSEVNPNNSSPSAANVAIAAQVPTTPISNAVTRQAVESPPSAINASAAQTATAAVIPPSATPASTYANKEIATPTPAYVSQDQAKSTTINPTQVADANVVKVLSSARPNFPREATQRGIQRGTVRARATINAAGEVTDVAILSASPVGIFNREVINAMQRWKFNAGTNNRAFETDITFQP
jgi:TonB family protein